MTLSIESALVAVHPIRIHSMFLLLVSSSQFAPLAIDSRKGKIPADGLVVLANPTEAHRVVKAHTIDSQVSARVGYKHAQSKIECLGRNTASRD